MSKACACFWFIYFLQCYCLSGLFCCFFLWGFLAGFVSRVLCIVVGCIGCQGLVLVFGLFIFCNAIALA